MRFQSTMLHVAALFLAASMTNADVSTVGLRGSELGAPVFLPAAPAAAVAPSPPVPSEASNITQMLTPHGADEPMEALAMLRGVLISQLSVPDWQWLVCLVAFSLGALLLCDPKGVFQFVVVTVVFCIGYIMTLGSLYERYDSEDHDANGVVLWEVVMAVEVAFCAAVIAWRGFEGIELVIGMTIGIWPLRFVQVSLVSLGIFGASPWWNIFIILFSGLLGLWLNAEKGRRLTLIIGYLLPILGGRLVSSTVGWLILSVRTQQIGGVWLDFWRSLPLDVYDPAVQQVRQALGGAPGIGWTNLPSVPPTAGYAAGCGIWFVFSLIAVIAHHHRVQSQRKTVMAMELHESLNH